MHRHFIYNFIEVLMKSDIFNRFLINFLNIKVLQSCYCSEHVNFDDIYQIVRKIVWFLFSNFFLCGYSPFACFSSYSWNFENLTESKYLIEVTVSCSLTSLREAWEQFECWEERSLKKKEKKTFCKCPLIGH